jgi:hypothetical protein
MTTRRCAQFDAKSSCTNSTANTQWRLRNGHGAKNITVVGHFALNSVRQVVDQRSIKRRRKRATWDPQYLLDTLGPVQTKLCYSLPWAWSLTGTSSNDPQLFDSPAKVQLFISSADQTLKTIAGRRDIVFLQSLVVGSLKATISGMM